MISSSRPRCIIKAVWDDISAKTIPIWLHHTVCVRIHTNLNMRNLSYIDISNPAESTNEEISICQVGVHIDYRKLMIHFNSMRSTRDGDSLNINQTKKKHLIAKITIRIG